MGIFGGSPRFLTISGHSHFASISPVLEINYSGYRGRRTKDIWEDQKGGGPKNIRSLGNQTTLGTNKIQEAGRGRKLNIYNQLDKGGSQKIKMEI